MAARDDVQRVAAALARPRTGYLKRVKADGTAIAARSGEAARQLGVFADRIADLTIAELRELHQETFGEGALENTGALAIRLARHRTDAADARLALDVLLAAIRYEGSTLSDGTYRNALNQDGGYQNEHRVYEKAGTPCSQPHCLDKIERIVQAQRSTFFCPACQK